MTTETITQIALDELHESPFNPRRSFVGLDDLAASIKSEQRVHEPLLVRPRTVFGGDGNRQSIDDGGFEIVFGHRRFRAAALAGLTHVPCMVRAMNDTEARSAQIAENLQRADVHPIEEAEGFQAMIENDGISADELGAVVGKSRSYIYGRLKLLQACPEVRTACLEGRIGSEVALLIARLRTPELQSKALSMIKQDTSQHANLEDGGKKSFRYIRDLLAERFTLDLGRAIFDPEDAALVPSAGVCTTCPKLTGNAPEFADLAAPQREGRWHHDRRGGNPRACTDPDCFAAKKAAHLAATAANLTAKGATVITGNKAKAAVDAYGQLKSAYVPLASVQAALKKAGATPQVLTIIDQKTGRTIEAIKASDVPSSKQTGAATASHPSSPQAAFLRERQERDQAQQTEVERRRGIVAALRPQMLDAQACADELRLIVLLVLKYIDPDVEKAVLGMYGLQIDREMSTQMQALRKLSPDQLRTMLLNFVLEEAMDVSWHNPSDDALLAQLQAVYSPAPAKTDSQTADLFEAAQEEAEA